MANINVPVTLKSLMAYIKTANEMEKRDPVVSYYCRLYTVQRGMEIDRKSPESKKFLMEIMDKLDKTKTELKDNESILSEVVGQAHLEEYALRLFSYADKKDKEGDFGQATVSSFMTSGYLMDVLGVFGEVAEDMEKCRKYAKWKAVYITQCLKNGEVPHCGPLEDHDQIASANGMFSNQPSVTVVQPPPVTTSRTQTSTTPGTHPQLTPSTQTNTTTNKQPHTTPRTQTNATPGTQPQVTPVTQPHTTPQTNKPISANTQKPTSNTAGSASGVPAATQSRNLSPEDYAQAEKYCRYATSALQYQDADTAINYLRQGLELLSRSKK